MSESSVGLKMQTVGKAPADTIRSMPAMVLAIGSMPAMISPDTAPRRSRPAQYSIASKKSPWPSVFALPGQIRANQAGSRSSTQKDR